VDFHFATTPPDILHASVTFKMRADGEWAHDGWTLSGDPAAHARARHTVESALKEIPLSDLRWPVGPETQAQLLAAARELQSALEDLAFAPPGSSWQLDEVALRHFPEWEARNSVGFDFQVHSGRERLAWVNAEFRHDGEEFWLREVSAGCSSSSSSREHSAMAESALREWIGTGRAPFRADEKERGWKSAAAPLAGGVRLLYEQRPVHLLLAEYDMRMTLSTPEGTFRRFVLPMNTGGRTQVLVFEGRTPEGGRALRLSSPPHFDAAFNLEPLRWIEVSAAGEWKFLGAFLETHAPLAWVSASEPRAIESFQKARDRGYPAAWEAFESQIEGR